MEIYPFDLSAEQVLEHQDVSDIQAEGITVRCGNKVLKLQVTDETVIDDADSIRRELEDQFKSKYEKLVSDFENYKTSMKHTLDTEKSRVERKLQQMEREREQISQLPNLSYEHHVNGLSVSLGLDGRTLVWHYKTIYAPKRVNNRQIEPAFCKRLITPVVMEITTNGNKKVTNLVVRKIIGGEKFDHYHSMGDSSDCWGEFDFSGLPAEDADQVINICKEASFILETINEFSLAKRNPSGLSRFDTIKRHLLPENESEQEDVKITNPRHRRSGVVENPNDFVENVWST